MTHYRCKKWTVLALCAALLACFIPTANAEGFRAYLGDADLSGDIDAEDARIALRFACDDGHLDIRVLALDDEAHAGTLTEDELEVMRCILDALVDEVAFDVRDGRIASVCMKAALSR